MSEKYTLKDFKNGEFSIKTTGRKESDKIEEFLKNHNIENYILNCRNGIVVSISIENKSNPNKRIGLLEIEEYRNETNKYKYKDFITGKFAIKRCTAEDFVKIACKLQTIGSYGNKDCNLCYDKLLDGTYRESISTLKECENKQIEIISIDELDLNGFEPKSQDVIDFIKEEIEIFKKSNFIRNKIKNNKCLSMHTTSHNAKVEISIGEQRVRTKFNPSKTSEVDVIKQKTAELINLVRDSIESIVDTGVSGEFYTEYCRLCVLAENSYEEGAMWAVKALTIDK